MDAFIFFMTCELCEVVVIFTPVYWVVGVSFFFSDRFLGCTLPSNDVLLTTLISICVVLWFL